MTLENHILELADRCVKCGLCLPHCPTYGLSQDENESPRGRIALLQGLALGRLDADAPLRRHLDRCLDCRACERVCPAGVEYEKLLDQGKALIGGGRDSWVASLPRRAGTLRRLNSLLRLYQKSGLQWLLRHSPLLPARWRYYDSLLPPLRPARRHAERYPVDAPRHKLALFTGCLGSTLEQQTVDAAIALLNRLGIEVAVIAGQTCCGALAQHNGDPAGALQLAARNIAAFADSDAEAIVYLATGCGAQLVNYADLPWPDAAQRQRAGDFVNRLQEITDYLARLDWPETLRFRPLGKRIAVHQPCSQKNGLRQNDAALALLRRIPDAEVETLAGNDRCCGAAGSYMLRQSELARTFRKEKLKVIEQSQAQVVATTNAGCSLFLGAGMDKVPVVHPVVLLEEVTKGEQPQRKDTSDK